MAKAKVIQSIMQLKDRFTPTIENSRKGMAKYKKDVRDLKKVGSAAFKTLAVGVTAFGVASVGAATGLAAVVNKTAAAGDEVDKMSQRLGVSRQSYQEWKHVLDQNGVSMSAFERATKNTHKAMIQASQGNKTAQDTFRRLGVSINDENGKLKSREQIFEDTIKTLSKYEDTAERTAVAQKLLGENAGREFTALINSGADSIEELRQEAHKLGIVMSDSAIDNAVLFTDQLDKLKKAGTGAFRQLGIVALPWFNRGIEWVLNKLPTVREHAVNAFGYISGILADNRERFESLKNVFLDVRDTIYDSFSPGGTGGGALSWFIQTGIPLTIGGIARVLEIASSTYFFFKDNWSLISPLVYGIVGALAAYNLYLKYLIIKKHALTTAQWLWNAAMTANPIGLVIVGIGALIAAGVFLIKQWDNVSLAGKKVWNGIVGAVEWGVNAYIKYLNFLIDTALGGINRLIRLANNIPGVDIDELDYGIKEADFGAVKFDTEGQSFQWRKKKDENKEFEDILKGFEKEQDIQIKTQQASNDKLIMALDDNTEMLQSTRGGGNTINVTVNGSDLTAEEIADKLIPRIERRLFA